MPLYDYIGTTSNGKTKKGRISAGSRHEALLQIDQKGLMIRNIREHSDSIWFKDLTIGRSIRLKDKVIFLRQFATIIKAGVTVSEALEILTDQEEKNKKLKAVIRQMSAHLNAGQTLSQAFENHPKVFSPMIVHMIRSGEGSGRLEESLDHLAVYYERRHRSRQKISTAMVYPVFILLMSAGVVLFLLTTIIPMFRTLFEGLNARLPLITRLILSVSDWIRTFWPILFISLFVIFCFIFFFLKNKSVKFWLDGAIIRLPVIGPLVYKNELSRLLWMLALLFSSSVPVIDALQSIEKITSNLAIRRSIRDTMEALDLGRSLSDAFRSAGGFPSIVCHMTAIGEKTGMLDQMLNHVARYYEDDVDQMLERMKALIEPVVIIFLAVLVGFIVMAIVIPMFQFYQQF
ncbi:type II secretion system F family protein [Sporolactobacillus sp. THM7-4]|nr:type II secretion system F family protein [Sporolactobacillus sp. THM7-4]